MVVESGLEQLANELSVRALEEQEAVLTELRARAGVLLAATALVASFLGARALSDGSLWLSAPGFLATLISILLCVYVLVPSPRVTFAVLAIPAYLHFTQIQADLAEAHRALAYWNQEAWERNQPVIERLVPCFRASCWAPVVSVVLWSLKLAID
jgi:hypothetical protein